MTDLNAFLARMLNGPVPELEGQREDVPLAQDEIPRLLLKPTSGPCAECGQDCDEQIDGEWLHQDCFDAAVEEQRAEDRHNDPRHGQAAELNRRR